MNTGYLTDPAYKEYVELFDKYKEITLYFTEGLDRVISDEYRNALAYFKYAIDLENDWTNDLFVKDKKGESVKLNGEKLRRSKEIDAYAKACLKVCNKYTHFKYIFILLTYPLFRLNTMVFLARSVMNHIGRVD